MPSNPLPVVRVTRINLRPLFPKGVSLEDLDIQKALKKAQVEIRKAIKKHIQASAFSRRAKIRLSEAIRIRLGPKSVTVTSRDPAFMALLEGRRARQMTWLVKARAPIPIVTDDGTLIFRSATPKSMANGSWYHPGRPGTNILGRAKAAAREQAKKYIVRELERQLKRMVQTR